MKDGKQKRKERIFKVIRERDIEVDSDDDDLATLDTEHRAVVDALEAQQDSLLKHQETLDAWDACQRQYAEAADAYTQNLEDVIRLAQGHLKRSKVTNVLSVFSDLVHGARQQKAVLEHTAGSGF